MKDKLQKEKCQVSADNTPKENRFEDIWSRLSPETRKQSVRASEYTLTPPGYLNNYDICIIWGGPEWAEMGMDGASTSARDYVTKFRLPLMEIGDGKWVVKYTNRRY